MKKTKWFAALAACVLVLLVAGCDNGSDGSGEPEEPVAVESIDVSKKTLSLEVGVMEKLETRIMPSDATDKTVKWSSSKPEVATVGDDDTVKGVKVGRATITAQAGDKTDTCEVTVSAHTHYYVNWKCTTCGFDKPSFNEGDIDDNGTLTKYTGSGTTVTIPKGVTCIGDGAFKGKTSLTSVTLPDGTTRIEQSAFEGCTGLASMTIPDTVTYIAYQAFKDCTSLASVTIPGSVTEIGDGAFEGCTKLASVTIDDGVTEIGSCAFEGCTGLASMTISDTVTYIAYQAFKDCTSLASVTIPDGVTEIGSRAFKGCTGLTEVTIGDSVTKIGSSAFEGGTGLTSVTIPASVTEIGSIAFYECTSLKEIQFNGTKAQWNAIEGSDDVTITCINCTDGHIGVKDVPEYLKISGRTVTGHNGEVPANLVIPDGVTEIGKSAFYNCADIETVTIPGSVTAIEGLGTSSSDHGAFEGCANLKTVTMGDGVKTIGSSAFKGCTSLANVTIPASVTKIGMSAFESCTGLTSVTMDDGVKTIGYCAFEWCTSLASVTIPASVTEIGQMAFHYCSKLETVKYTGTEEQWKNIAKDSSWAPSGTSYEIMYNYTE